MSVIKTLDEHLTNMIAAGEVVERPMGVVKELVENSLDAQADQIAIYVTDGGCSSIEVRDNGCGMDQTDATQAFNRHATSKISTANDLWSISTMGFRGEALPSIASVSKVTLDTSNEIDSTHVQIDYGKLVSAQPGPCPKGTRIQVKELFYKTPARLKHLKSGNVELNYILELVQKMALAHPEVAFSFYSDGKLRLQTTGHNDLKEVLFAIYGAEAAGQAVEVNFGDYDFKVTGVIVLPSVTRSNRQYLNLFINQRLIRSYVLQKAVLEAYSGYAMPDRYPIVALNIMTDPHLVDVNVHPSKWEVRISKEKSLYNLIQTNLAEIIHSKMQPITIKQTAQPAMVYEQQTWPAEPTISREIKDEQPSATYQLPVSPKAEPDNVIPTINSLPELTFLTQFHGRYILAADEEQLYIVDQHAAMERCMYEQIQKQIAAEEIITQPLIVPLVISLTPAQMSQLDSLNEHLAELGLQLEPFSTASAVVRSVPIWLQDVDEQSFIRDVIDLYGQGNSMMPLAVRKEKIASLACHRSVKFNRHLNESECRTLLANLKQCQQPYNCPHGRPTLIAISESKLRKEFERE